MALQAVKGAKKTAPAKKTAKTKQNNKKVNINFTSKPSAKTNKPAIMSDGVKGIIDNITTSLGLKFYSKEVIKDSRSMIKKSETHLLGLIKYYEGDSSNCYEGKLETYKDKYGQKTKGFGCTKKLVKIRTQEEAYIQLEKDLKEAREGAKNKINNRLGKGVFEKLPLSIQEGLIDLSFCKGPNAVVENKNLLNAIKNKDYSGVIGNIYYLHSANKSNGAEEDPGLYRRSLSRAILATRDLTGKEKAEAGKEIDKLYTKAKKCFEKNKKSTNELEDIYTYFKTKTFSNTEAKTETNKTNNTTSNSYNFVVDESFKGKGAFAVAKANYDKQDTSKMSFKEFYELFNKINSQEVLNNIKVGSEVKIPIIGAAKTTTEQKTQNKKTTAQPTQDKKAAPKKVSTQKPVATEKVAVQKTTSEQPKQVEKESGNFITRFFKRIFGSESSEGNISSGISDIEEYGRDNDPNSAPFNLLMNDKNKKLQRNRVVVKFKNNSSKTYVTYTISLDYKVKKYSESPNETVWGISHRYGLDMNNFCENNNIKDNSYIQAGQIVKIQKLGYKVENGETINSIAKKFGLTPDILMQLNGIDDDNDTYNLPTGKMIELPGFIYKVKKGDTFESIAKKAGINVRILKYINGNKLDSEIKVLYNNPDFNKKIETIKTTTINGKKVQKIDMSSVDKDVRTREHLRYKTLVDGLVVANRAEFAPTNKNGKLKGRTIIINAGHGYGQASRDPGAVVERNGLKHEWILNYDNSMRLITKLQAQGAKVIYLQGHRNLIQKALKQPENKGDLFISVHANIGKGDDTTRDRTQFYYRENVQNGSAKQNSMLFARIAEYIFDKKYSNKNEDNAEVRTNDDRTGLLKTPVNNQRIGGIIWEVAFMDSPKGRKKLQSDKTMNEYTQMMTQAVIKYFETFDNKKTLKRELH